MEMRDCMNMHTRRETFFRKLKSLPAHVAERLYHDGHFPPHPEKGARALSYVSHRHIPVSTKQKIGGESIFFLIFKLKRKPEPLVSRTPLLTDCPYSQ
jgi:hypothetical protein